MKNRNISAVILVAGSFMLSSCGNSTGGSSDSTKKDSTAVVEQPQPKFSELCKDPNSVTLTIKGYKYGMKGDFEFAGAFDVKQANFTMSNDSNATLTLRNYSNEELVGDRKDNQVDINIELRSRNGKKITAGDYIYFGRDDFSSSVTMTTSKGTVYFNWVDGMPKQGAVKLNCVEGNKTCGEFILAVDKPDSDQIGTVRLNGHFSIGN